MGGREGAPRRERPRSRDARTPRLPASRIIPRLTADDHGRINFCSPPLSLSLSLSLVFFFFFFF